MEKQGRGNLNRPADWNRKPDAGYIHGQPNGRLPTNNEGTRKEESRAERQMWQTNKNGVLDKEQTEAKQTDSPGRKDEEGLKRFSTNMPRPMTPTLPGSGLLSQRQADISSIQQIPSLGLRDYYRDSKLFEVIQQGILMVGKERPENPAEALGHFLLEQAKLYEAKKSKK